MLIVQSLRGVRRRGEQDDMILRELALPGFGGFYIDENDEVVVYMKPGTDVSDAVVRRTLVSAYASRAEPRIREVMPRAARAKILPAQFSLSELIAIENRIMNGGIRIPGSVGVGTSLMLNRVILGFRDSVSAAAANSAIRALGLPEAAVIPEVWGDFVVTTSWSNFVRPTRGGIKTAIVNRVAYPGDTIYEEASSYGYTVTNGSTSYFMMSGHAANSYRGINGVTGDSVFQPNWGTSNAIGRIAINPSWDSQCQMNPSTNQPFDYCVDADVALGTFFSGVFGDRKIGTSMYEGQNGAKGTDAINNWYPISSVATPEFISTTSNGVHKSGFITGTTTGAMVIPDVQVWTRMCWSLTNCPPTGGVWVFYWNLTRVNHAGWGWGDSGGPVFAGNGSPYYAVGIQVGGSGQNPNDTVYCTAGTNCTFYFIRWSEIELKLGLGTLNPATNQ